MVFLVVFRIRALVRMGRVRAGNHCLRKPPQRQEYPRARHVFGAHSHHSLPSFVSVSLWPFVRSSAGLINHTHPGAAAWIYRRGAGCREGEIDSG